MAEIKLQIIEGPKAGKDLDVEGAAVIGRDPDSAALVVEDPEASRRHASVIPEGQSLNIEDLGSTNGTFVNGERLVGARVVVPGDRLRIGTTVLEVAIAATAEAPVAAASGGARTPGPGAVDEEAVGAAPLAGVSGGSPEQPPAGGPPPPPPPGDPEGPGAPPPPPPPTQAPPGTPPPVAYGGPPDYPIDLQIDYPEAGIARWRPLLHWLLVIPHFIVLLFVGLAAYIVWAVAFFAIIITGRYPEGMFNFLAGTFRWNNRVIGFEYWMTEEYPPFSLGEETQYPVRTRFEYPPDGKIARWRPLVHWLLAIPHIIVLYFLFIAEGIILFISFFAVIFTRQWPRSMFDFTVGIMRWRTRVIGYSAWMTEEYPPFSLD